MPRRGEAHPARKLHPDMVPELLKKLETMTYAQIAAEYGCSIATLANFLRRRVDVKAVTKKRCLRKKVYAKRTHYIEQKPKRVVASAWDFSGDNLNVRD